MAGEILTALSRLEDRKDAVLGESETTRGATHVGTDGYRLQLAGSGLDFTEILEARELIAQTFVAAVSQGVNPLEVGAEIFVDGLLTGILIAEERQKAEAS